MANAEDQSANKPVRVFISYSHKDEKKWKAPVVTHLKPLVHEGDIILWDDRKIGTGTEWYREIKEELEKADIAVCLISADYLASDFINKEEIPAMKKRRKDEGMLLLPLLLSPCAWKVVRWLKDIQMFPRDGVSLAEIKPKVAQTKALADFAVKISERIATQDFATPAPAPAFTPPEKVDITRLPETGAELFGREKELQLLGEMWDSDAQNVVSLVAWGGVGKSTLVNQWLRDLQVDNYRGAKRVFAWSFYSQGTGQRVTSADQFITNALEFFGDAEMAQSTASPWDKGERLAHLVRQEKTLLILDGLEPLQSGFDFDKGKITDPALSVLVTQLARQNNGLCVITTRENVAELKQSETGVMQLDLEQISKQAGRALLRVGGVQGTDEELEAASESFGNHALAVSLLATYLHGIKGHHVSHAASIPDLDIPEAKGKHPRRVIEAFHTGFGNSPQTQLLRVMGLFDRPPGLALIEAVKAPPAIAGLTDNLMQLDGGQWRDVLGNLRACKLLASESAHNPNVLDCHPLIREHYAAKLTSEQPKAWQAAHRRLYEHLTQTTEHQPDTLAGLQPLYQAIAHGCLAGMQQEACNKVYFERISRGNEYYSIGKLGASGSDLAAVACFFERPFSALSEQLSESDQAWLLAMASFHLRALGRLNEALEPMRTGLDMGVQQEDWGEAARRAFNLSELELTLGQVAKSIEDAEHSVDYADRSGDWEQRMIKCTTYADALFQSRQAGKAAALFEEAEAMQAERQPQYPLLYSLRGFQYCDLLLAPAERQAWQHLPNPKSEIGASHPDSAFSLERSASGVERGTRTAPDLKSREACKIVEKRATQTLEWVTGKLGLVDIALDHLTLGRAALYKAILAKSEIRNHVTPDEPALDPDRGIPRPKSEFEEAVAGLRRAGQLQYLPLGLLSRALLRLVESDMDGCRADLDEAWQIAERGSMRLFMADVHLHRARLFRDKEALAEARKLIDECGYHRRDPELQDAQKAAQNW